MNLTRIVAFVLFLIALAMGYYLYNSIAKTIEYTENIKNVEKQIIDKLEVIREAEKVFLEQYGRYTSNWDSLINFIENGQVPIIQRREIIKPASYGVDCVKVYFDTLGFMSARDKIFKKTYTVSAADNGEFVRFFVNEGEQVVKGKKSYAMKRDKSDKVDEYTFLEKGTVSSLAKIQPGDRVTKGQFLISFWDYQLNPNVDVKNLNVVPGSGKTFDIYTGRIDRNGLLVWVIEVKDPAPINPERRESNEAKNRKPLRFGSRTDVTTSGNWE
jgi:biotin carboxyl carrier protein